MSQVQTSYPTLRKLVIKKATRLYSSDGVSIRFLSFYDVTSLSYRRKGTVLCSQTAFFYQHERIIHFVNTFYNIVLYNNILESMKMHSFYLIRISIVHRFFLLTLRFINGSFRFCLQMSVMRPGIRCRPIW